MTKNSASAAVPTPNAFGVTWDYRCPFARNAHEHIITAIEGGTRFDVTWVPLSLSEMHIEEGEPSVFDDPGKRNGLLATEVGLVVRDRFPDHWLGVHRALFALRHDESGDLRDREELRGVLARRNLDPDEVFAEVDSGWPLDTFRKEHEAAVRDYSAWGVPTFLVGDQAAFVRLMTRPNGDAGQATRTIEHVLRLFAEVPELNEFKYTSIPN